MMLSIVIMLIAIGPKKRKILIDKKTSNLWVMFKAGAFFDESQSICFLRNEKSCSPGAKQFCLNLFFIRKKCR